MKRLMAKMVVIGIIMMGSWAICGGEIRVMAFNRFSQNINMTVSYGVKGKMSPAKVYTIPRKSYKQVGTISGLSACVIISDCLGYIKNQTINASRTGPNKFAVNIEVAVGSLASIPVAVQSANSTGTNFDICLIVERAEQTGSSAISSPKQKVEPKKTKVKAEEEI